MERPVRTYLENTIAHVLLVLKVKIVKRVSFVSRPIFVVDRYSEIGHIYHILATFSDINECESSPCANGATCMDKVNGYNCTCLDGFEGDNCQTSKSILLKID